MRCSYLFFKKITPRISSLLMVFVSTIPLSCFGTSEHSSIYIAVGAGYASPAASGFDASWSGEINAGYDTDSMGFSFSYVETGNFEVINSPDSSINMEFWRADLYKRIALANDLYFEPMIGLSYWDASAKLVGLEVGQDSGHDFTWGLKFSFQLKHHLFTRLSWINYRDHAGTDIDSLNILFGYGFH